MNELTLFHGSPVEVMRPTLEKCRPRNDYGPGFYCTQDKDLACEWACGGSSDGVVNEYVLACDGLRFLDFDACADGVLGWVATLVRFRSVDYSSRAEAQTVKRFIDAYAVDVSQVDVVQGYRADDSYFDIVRAFIVDRLTVGELEDALRLGDLGMQVVLRSQKAFDAVRFIGSEQALAVQWASKRKMRNEHAKQQFNEIRNASDMGEGLRFIDVVRSLA